MFNHFLFAVGFLTRIPVLRNQSNVENIASKTVPFYPAVGLIIGAIIVSFGSLLVIAFDAPLFLSAAIIVVIWVGITGALHLDGLADCADAWMSGGDRTRMLSILKDTTNGTGALVAVSLALIVKLTAVQAIISDGQWFALMLVPVIGRTAMMLTVGFFPYVRIDGLGSQVKAGLNIQHIMIATGLVAIVTVFHSVAMFVMCVIFSAIAVGLIYWELIRKLNGTTGDVFGVTVEVVELSTLVGVVLLV